MTDLTLYHAAPSRSSLVRWMLEELGEPYETRFIDIRDEAATEDREFRLASPMGKVPAIMDSNGDGPVYLADSAPICLYLADRYPARGLAPAVDDPARAPFLYWMNYTPGVIEPAMMEKFLGFEVSRATSGWGNYETMLEVLETGLAQGPWLLGERFSAADVLVGSSVWFMKKFGLLPENPVFESYIERCLARPAHRRALEREEEL
jgi:glutathione S-transferase